MKATSLHGCLRCCSYGSKAQRANKAKWLAIIIDRANEQFRELYALRTSAETANREFLEKVNGSTELGFSEIDSGIWRAVFTGGRIDIIRREQDYIYRLWVGSELRAADGGYAGLVDAKAAAMRAFDTLAESA